MDRNLAKAIAQEAALGEAITRAWAVLNALAYPFGQRIAWYLFPKARCELAESLDALRRLCEAHAASEEEAGALALEALQIALEGRE